MKVKTSITLSIGLLDAIDRRTDYASRSEFIELAVRRLLAELERNEVERRDLQIINRNADKLNAEAEDTLAYQVPL